MLVIMFYSPSHEIDVLLHLLLRERRHHRVRRGEYGEVRQR